LIGRILDIGHRMTPGVVRAKQQSMAQLLTKFYLERVVVGIAVRVLVIHDVQEWVGPEEVDREPARNIETRRDASGEFVAHQPAHVRSTGRQRIRQQPGGALVQVLNECRTPEAQRIGKRRLASKRPKRGLEDWKRSLSR